MIAKIVRAALLVATVGFVGTSASAGPAFVFKFDPGGCFFGWADFGFNFIALPGEAGIFVDTNTGNLSLVCHGQVPDDGSVPSVAQVKAALASGPGALIFTAANTAPGTACDVGGILTTDFQEVVTPNGRVHLVCKVHP